MAGTIEGKVVLPDKVLSNARITYGKNIESIEQLTGENVDRVIIPGFVDIHNHGMGGEDDMLKYWQNPSYTTERAARVGVTSLLATLTLPRELTDVTQRATEILDAIAGEFTGKGSVVEGIHAEGPIVADLGGLPESNDTMSQQDFINLVDSMKSLRVMTISPAREASVGFSRIRYLLQKGVTPAMGHDRNCSESDILGCLKVAAEVNKQKRLHITHVFNVSSFHHRKPTLGNFGFLGKFPNLPQYEGLSVPTVELNYDGQHVSPLVVQGVLDSKGTSGACCVTDCVTEAVAGKAFKYCGRDVEVNNTATAAVLKGTETLAGSAATMFDIFKRVIKCHPELSLPQVCEFLCKTPATVANISTVGALELGKRANFVVLSPDLQNIQSVVIHGNNVG